jgi:plasmid stability protein
MASITVRRLDTDTKARLRIRAAHHGRSMEQEAREILKVALTPGGAGRGNLAGSIRARFAGLGGVDLPDVPRDPLRRPPKLPR